MRLAKYLASCGLGSRRHCEELIRLGDVKINGIVIKTPVYVIDPSVDTIEYKDETVKPKKYVYYLLNKPVGVTSTRADSHAEKLITDFVPSEPPVWPVGRLDKDTSGLIILTNDGELTQHLTHPKYEKEKEYIIQTKFELSEKDIMQIREGIDLDDGQLKPQAFESEERNTYRIVIHEGRNRIIRRLISTFNNEVISLKRIRIDSLPLDDLPEGEYRSLNNEEVKRLTNDL